LLLFVHQNLSKNKDSKLKYYSNKQTFFAAGARRWPIVVFFGSSVFPEPSLLSALGSTDGPSVCCSAEKKIYTIEIDEKKVVQ